ncbi:MAG: hypothetical protein AAFP90_04065, partial [Planctomycetota bacterium]
MSAEDFQQLYKMVRGNRAATGVMDALTAFHEGDFEVSLQRLTQARDMYHESRSRFIKGRASVNDGDERAVKRTQRKQDKVMEAVEAFAGLLPKIESALERDAKRRGRKSTAAADDKNTSASKRDATNASYQSAKSDREPAASPSISSDGLPAGQRDVPADILPILKDADHDFAMEVVGALF